MRRVFHHTETRASCCTIYTSELKVLQEIRTPAREPSFLPFAVDTPLHRPSLEHVSRFADIVHLFSAGIGILQLLSQIRFVSQQGFGRVAPFLCEVKGKSRLWVVYESSFSSRISPSYMAMLVNAEQRKWRQIRISAVPFQYLYSTAPFRSRTHRPNKSFPLAQQARTQCHSCRWLCSSRSSLRRKSSRGPVREVSRSQPLQICPRLNKFTMVCRCVDSFYHDLRHHMVKMLWTHEEQPSESAKHFDHVIMT